MSRGIRSQCLPLRVALKAIVQVHDMEPIDLEKSLTTSAALQKRRVSQGTGNR